MYVGRLIANMSTSIVWYDSMLGGTYIPLQANRE